MTALGVANCDASTLDLKIGRLNEYFEPSHPQGTQNNILINQSRQKDYQAQPWAPLARLRSFPATLIRLIIAMPNDPLNVSHNA